MNMIKTLVVLSSVWSVVCFGACVAHGQEAQVSELSSSTCTARANPRAQIICLRALSKRQSLSAIQREEFATQSIRIVETHGTIRDLIRAREEFIWAFPLSYYSAYLLEQTVSLHDRMMHPERASNLLRSFLTQYSHNPKAERLLWVLCARDIARGDLRSARKILDIFEGGRNHTTARRIMRLEKQFMDLLWANGYHMEVMHNYERLFMSGVLDWRPLRVGDGIVTHKNGDTRLSWEMWKGEETCPEGEQVVKVEAVSEVRVHLRALLENALRKTMDLEVRRKGMHVLRIAHDTYTPTHLRHHVVRCGRLWMETGSLVERSTKIPVVGPPKETFYDHLTKRTPLVRDWQRLKPVPIELAWEYPPFQTLPETSLAQLQGRNRMGLRSIREIVRQTVIERYDDDHAYTKAVDAFSSILAEDPTIKAARSNLARVLIETRRLKRANDVLDQAQRIHPKDEEFALLRALWLLRSRELERGKQELLFLARSRDSNVRWKAFVNLAILAFQRDQCAVAQRWAERSIQEGQFNVVSYRIGHVCETNPMRRRLFEENAQWASQQDDDRNRGAFWFAYQDAISTRSVEKLRTLRTMTAHRLDLSVHDIIYNIVAIERTICPMCTDQSHLEILREAEPQAEELLAFQVYDALVHGDIARAAYMHARRFPKRDVRTTINAALLRHELGALKHKDRAYRRALLHDALMLYRRALSSLKTSSDRSRISMIRRRIHEVEHTLQSLGPERPKTGTLVRMKFVSSGLEPIRPSTTVWAPKVRFGQRREVSKVSFRARWQKGAQARKKERDTRGERSPKQVHIF